MLNIQAFELVRKKKFLVADKSFQLLEEIQFQNILYKYHQSTRILDQSL
jgi:hypothetical protein